MLTASARADGPEVKLTGQTLAEWWSAPGRPGFVEDAHLGNGLFMRYLGLTAGGVQRRDGLFPSVLSWPGLGEISAPLAWYDSAAVVVGENAGWNGFEAPLVELRELANVPSERRPRAAFTFINGSSSLERNGLLLQRGGARSWLRGGALTADRAGVGDLEQNGSHAWFAEVGQRRGDHTFSGAFSQRGLAGGTRRDRSVLLNRVTVPPFAGLEEAAHGEAGWFAWNWERGPRRATVRVAREHDHRESYGSFVFDVFAEREAQDDVVSGEFQSGDTLRAQGARVELRQGLVVRSANALGDPNFGVRDPVRDARRSAWAAVRAQRPFAGGLLELQLGAGWVDAPQEKGQRVQAAPSLVWRTRGSGPRARLLAERLVRPVWSDLAAGTPAFVQDTWLAGLDVGVGDRQRQWCDVSVLGADIGARAHLVPTPVRDLALRYGWTFESGHVQDAMVNVETGVRRGAHAVDATAFARVRPLGQKFADTDPSVGGRGGVETGFRAFAGDLGVRLRLEAGWVGSRDNVSLPEYFTPPRPLAGYVTYAGSLSATLGDARLVLRMANLEDERRPMSWTDPVSDFPGAPALTAGRQYRFELAWPFYN